MAEKILNTRIRLKFDTLEKWENLSTPDKGGNLILEKGEVAICEVPVDKSAKDVSGETRRPQYLMKVGDGKSPFKTLPWLNAIAADVYGWAKAATRPTYAYGDADLTGFGTAAAKAIEDFDEAGAADTAEQNAKDYTDEKIGEISGTDTLYQLVITGTTLKVQSKEKNAENWADVAGQSWDLNALLKGEIASGNTGFVTGNDVFVELGKKVAGVKTGEKVLSLDNDKNLQTTLTFDYDSTNKKIQLKGISGEVITDLDATNFIKDGMVSNVEFDPTTKKLTITFNTDAGKEAIEVDMTSLVDTYTAGKGIDITGNVISAKKDPASEAFLEITDAGLKLSGIQTAIDTAKQAAIDDAASKYSKVEKSDTNGNIKVDGSEVQVYRLDSDIDITQTAISIWGYTDTGKLAPTGLAVADVVTGDDLKTLTVGTKTYDTTADVTITATDLGVAEGATKVEASTTNGNIKINGTETTVYTLPQYVLKGNDLAPDYLAMPSAEPTEFYNTGIALSDLARYSQGVTAGSLELAAIATTGNVNDLVQTAGDTLIFDCGGSGLEAVS